MPKQKEGTEETERKSKEKSQASLAQLQLAEQGLQNLLLQKQVFQLEMVETNNALNELKKTKEENTFKIVGNLMLKSNKLDLTKELERKRDLLNLRIKAIEKQEEDLREKFMKTREEVLKGIKR